MAVLGGWHECVKCSLGFRGVLGKLGMLLDAELSDELVGVWFVGIGCVVVLQL